MGSCSIDIQVEPTRITRSGAITVMYPKGIKGKLQMIWCIIREDVVGVRYRRNKK